MKTREQFEAEARRMSCASFADEESKVRAFVAWAESIQQDAVDEERKALREITLSALNAPVPLGNDRRHKVCNEILAALDARSKP